MKYRILLLLSAATDPTVYSYSLEQQEEIQGVDVVTGETKSGLDEGINAFANGYSAVITELVLDHSTAVANLEGATAARINVGGFDVIRQGVMVANALDHQANYVVLSEWDNVANIYESYRCGAKAFVSRKHPLQMNDYVDSVIGAAAGESSYPNMNSATRNVAIAIRDSHLRILSAADLEVVDMLVNQLNTHQMQDLLLSRSANSTNGRISRIIRKLNLPSREELILQAIKAGMVQHNEYASRLAG